MERTSTMTDLKSAILKSTATHKRNQSKFQRRNAITTIPDIDDVDDTVALIALEVQKQ